MSESSILEDHHCEKNFKKYLFNRKIWLKISSLWTLKKTVFDVFFFESISGQLRAVSLDWINIFFKFFHSDNVLKIEEGHSNFFLRMYFFVKLWISSFLCCIKIISLFYIFQDMDLIKFLITCFQTYFPNVLGNIFFSFFELLQLFEISVPRCGLLTMWAKFRPIFPHLFQFSLIYSKWIGRCSKDFEKKKSWW